MGTRAGGSVAGGGLTANRLAECEQIAIRCQDQQFSLAVRLIDRPKNIARRQRVELRLQVLIKRIDVADIDIIGKSTTAGRRNIIFVPLQKPHAAPLTLDIRIASLTKQHSKPKHITEEIKRRVEVGDMHKWCDLN